MTDHNPPQQQPPQQPWPPQHPQQPYPPQQYPPAPPAPQQPLQAAPPAKKKRGPLVAVAVLGVLALCCGGVVAAVNSGGGDKAASSASSAPGGQAEPVTGPAPTKAAAPPPAPAKPRVLLTVKGSGIKNTAKFTTGDEWQLKYSFDCSNFGYKGNFQVFDYVDGSDVPDILTNELAKKGADTVPVYSAGRHYFKVNTECKWSITVLG